MSTVPANSTLTAEPSFGSVLSSMTTMIGIKGAEPFPVVDKLWDVFAGKGIRTVFLSIGTSKSPLADLDITESIGCPLHIFPVNEAEKAKWQDVSTVLKERKREPDASSFTELVDTKWILPKNLRVLDSLPWWSNGTMDMSGTLVSTQKLETTVSSLCSAMKLKDGMKRIDILKIDTTQSAPGMEIPILNCIITAGYRPSVILVKWSAMPDLDLAVTTAAGHLQCSGYSLLNVVEDKFLYYFNDDNLYEICSWEKQTTMNPIAQEIIKAVTSSIKKPSISAAK
jgi:hypothetical protein